MPENKVDFILKFTNLDIAAYPEDNLGSRRLHQSESQISRPITSYYLLRLLLPEKERIALEMKNGFEDGHRATMNEIAEALNVSEQEAWGLYVNGEIFTRFADHLIPN